MRVRGVGYEAKGQIADRRARRKTFVALSVNLCKNHIIISVVGWNIKHDALANKGLVRWEKIGTHGRST